jgi:hypothetical protein
LSRRRQANLWAFLPQQLEHLQGLTGFPAKPFFCLDVQRIV